MHPRYKQTKFMNKNLLKAVMNRSRLLNRYRKEATTSAYKREKFLCKTIKKGQKGFLQ